eukprot:GHVS01034580.1.p1 GENE.GHVS01034580.1~~GHVS01034580.1.p1  ORF type:complete len:208 (+),score=9.75 GHVS01034580.1:192-815(+)
MNRHGNSFKFLYHMLLGMRLNEARKEESLRTKWQISLYGRKDDTLFGEAFNIMKTRFVVAINAFFLRGKHWRITYVVLKAGSTERKLEVKNLNCSESFVLLRASDCELIRDTMKKGETVKLVATWRTELCPDKHLSKKRKRRNDDCPVPLKTRFIGPVPLHTMEYPADEESGVVEREFQIGDEDGEATILLASVEVGNHYSLSVTIS